MFGSAVYKLFALKAHIKLKALTGHKNTFLKVMEKYISMDSFYFYLPNNLLNMRDFHASK